MHAARQDADGIVDGADKCLTVYAKTADGCPAAPPKKLVLEGVNFANNQAVLQQDSYAALDAAAATLKEWGEVKVEVAGHTDSVARTATTSRCRSAAPKPCASI